jgi:hypothetical protein
LLAKGGESRGEKAYFFHGYVLKNYDKQKQMLVLGEVFRIVSER